MQTETLNKQPLNLQDLLLCNIWSTWQKHFPKAQTFRIIRNFNTHVVQYLNFISLRNNPKELEYLSQATFLICGEWRTREMSLRSNSKLFFP